MHMQGSPNGIHFGCSHGKRVDTEPGKYQGHKRITPCLAADAYRLSCSCPAFAGKFDHAVLGSEAMDIQVIKPQVNDHPALHGAAEVGLRRVVENPLSYIEVSEGYLLLQQHTRCTDAAAVPVC